MWLLYNSDFSIIKSNKSGVFLNINNYKFRIKNKLKDGSTYQCIDCNINCKLLIDNTLLIKQGIDYETHDHPNHLKKIEKHLFRNQIKNAILSDKSTKISKHYGDQLEKQKKKNIQIIHHRFPK